MPSPNPLARLEHTGGAVPTTLVGSITAADLAFSIDSPSGWPTGAVGNFYVVFDAGTVSEEKVLCSSLSGGVVTVAPGGRGQDGTLAKTHANGATVYPVWTAVEADQANEHAASIAAVHGVAGNVVGTTDAQTLTNKTISGATNTLSNIASAAVTGLDGHIAATTAHGATGAVVGTTNTQTLTNKTIDGASNTVANLVALSSPQLYPPVARDERVTGEWSTYDRQLNANYNTEILSGTLSLVYFTATHSGTTAGIRFYVWSAGAAGVVTLARVGLWLADGAGNCSSLVASTANDTALFTTTGQRTKSWSSSYAMVAGQRYALGLLSVGREPFVMGLASGNAPFYLEWARAPRLSGMLAGQSDLPATVTAGSLHATLSGLYRPYVALT